MTALLRHLVHVPNRSALCFITLPAIAIMVNNEERPFAVKLYVEVFVCGYDCHVLASYNYYTLLTHKLEHLDTPVNKITVNK